MPKTKGQGVVFGIFMSIFMAYGMEVYNVAIKMGYTIMPGGLSNMKNEVFLEALKEAAYMWVFVFIFSNLFGNILIFMPYGYFLTMAGKRKSFFRTLFYSMGLSLGVEVMQLLTKVGSFDVDDILLNTVGGVLGFLIYMTGDLIRRRHVRNRKK